MFKLRKSKERGYTQLNWLESWHTFSFDSYYDSKHNHFESLRVINEDTVAPKAGFGTHQHKDMEILTYVLQGALEHKDSLGSGSIIKPGELQRMSAGTGIFHSEYNHSQNEPVHLLQIWIMPNRRDLTPGYEQKQFDIEYGAGWKLIASEEGSGGSLKIHQDVSVYAAKIEPGEKLNYKVNGQRGLWLQVAEGNLQVNDNQMSAGDGAAINELKSIELVSSQRSHILLFDLAAK
jgi:quercetin 2,3-dioxygenase